MTNLMRCELIGYAQSPTFGLDAGIELGENGSVFPRPKGKAGIQIKGALTEADTLALRALWLSLSSLLFRLSL